MMAPRLGSGQLRGDSELPVAKNTSEGPWVIQGAVETVMAQSSPRRGEHVEVKVSVTQSCSTVCNSMDCSPPGASVHGILQARILEWVVMYSFRGSSRPRDRTWVSCTAGRFITV